MITIIFNNKPIPIAVHSTLQAFLEKALDKNTYAFCAAAVNRHFVSRDQHDKTILREKDVVDIVIPMQGG